MDSGPWIRVCALCVPYALRALDDRLHDVLSDLLPVVFVDVEGEGHLTRRWLAVLPVLTHHVFQVDGGWTHTHARARAHTRTRTRTHTQRQTEVLRLLRLKYMVLPSYNCVFVMR